MLAFAIGGGVFMAAFGGGGCVTGSDPPGGPAAYECCIGRFGG